MKYFLLLFFLIISRFAAAQTIDIAGTVKNGEGQPLHFAFIKDVQTKNAVYTDSVGNFTIKASGGSSLYVNNFGYKDTLIDIKNRTAINIVLKIAVTISANKTAASRQSPLVGDAAVQQLSASMSRDNLAGPGTNTAAVAVAVPGAPFSPGHPGVTASVAPNTFDAAQGAILPQFNPKEETEGSRYLLKGWVHGFVINSKDSTVQDPGFLFAYDKMGGGLLMTQNQVSAIEINREIVKSFTLYNNADAAYTFENVPQIDNNHYVQVLASGSKYRIYKAIKTHFEKANYTSDGVMSSGHNYDEYNDEDTYYVYNVQTNALQKIALKKKALKDVFANEADKLNKFMNDHSSDTIDDFYLTALGAVMNE